ncbi:MAG: SDR family oxidoreductase [Vulcanimicrobiaceae bacterium]
MARTRATRDGGGRFIGLTDKVVLVTGATSGIGRAAACQLAALGAHVILGVRDVVRGVEVADGIERDGGRANVLALDVASLASVRDAAERFRASYPTLDVLVNNAGILATKRRESADGHELTWATNFLGLVALTQALVPALARASEPRVVNVSSAAHNAGRLAWDDLERTRRYRGFAAYAQSKLALNLYTREFAVRYPHIAANAVHPGAIATDVWRGLPAIVRGVLGRALPDASRGAVPLVRLAASDDVRGRSGRYFDRLRETAPSKASRNDDDARRLFAYALQTCGDAEIAAA